MKVNRATCLIAGTIMMLFSGIIYAWSILKAPLAEEFGWNNSQLGMNYSIMLGSFCLGIVAGGFLLKKFSPKMLTGFWSLGILAGFLLSAANQNNLLLFYISYGVMCGGSIGVLYNTILTTVTSWYPDRRGTASGVLMMGFGFSSLILGYAATYLIGILGWRSCYVVLGSITCIVALCGSFFMKPCPDKPVAANEATFLTDITTRQMIRKDSFWKCYIYSFLIVCTGVCIISFAKDIATEAGAAETIAIMLVGVLSVSNGAARILFGYLFDRCGRRRAMLVSYCATALSLGLLLVAVSFESMAALSAGIILAGLSYGSMPPLSSGFVSKTYGVKHFASNFSILNTCVLFASFASAICGAIVTRTNSFTWVFVLLLACTFIAFWIYNSLRKTISIAKQ